MIPFNHLGWLFNRFGNAVYPRTVIEAIYGAVRPVQSGGSVLDLGAGTGIAAAHAYRYRRDLRYVAVDPAEGMLRYVPDPIETVCAGAEALPFASASFDALLLCEALHHFNDPDAAFIEIARVLKADGVLFIYEFDPSTLPGRLLSRSEKLLGEPGHFYPSEMLVNTLETHGFNITAQQTGWRYTLTASLKRSAEK